VCVAKGETCIKVEEMKTVHTCQKIYIKEKEAAVLLNSSDLLCNNCEIVGA